MVSRRRSAGFTLVELLVVLAIIVVITGIAMTSQSAYNKTLVLANTAYDVALSLRAAETYGLGSRAANVTSNVAANAGYGLHFDRSTPSRYTLFADTYPPVGSSPLCHPPPSNDPSGPNAQPGNCAFDPAQETITTYTLGNGITINDFCGRSSSGSWSCAVANGGTLSSLDIVFSRPNPDPFVNGVYPSAACLSLTSPQGGARYVSVTASGAISGNAASCP